MEDFVNWTISIDTPFKQYETTNIKDKQEKLPKISKMFRIIKWINWLVEDRNYRPQEFMYQEFSYLDLMLTPGNLQYKEIVYRVQDELQRLKWRIEEERKQKYDVYVYKVQRTWWLNDRVRIVYWVDIQEQIKPSFEYWLVSYPSNRISWIQVTS